MKVKRMVAALLCAAMVMTSQGVIVSADEPVTNVQDTVSEALDDVIVNNEDAQPADTEEADAAVEEAAEAEPVVQEAVVSDVTEPEDEEQKEADDNTEGIKAGQDEDIDADGALDPTPCFDVQVIDGKNTLILKPQYESLNKTGFTSVAIPAEVEVIPQDETLFYRNTTVKTVQFVGGTNLVTIKPGAFEDSVIETFISPAGYTKIEERTFAGCTNLKTFDFKNITTIGDNAFDGCTNLGKGLTTWSGFIEEIGRYAFRNTGFTALDLTAAVTKYSEVTMGSYAFFGCKDLTSITIPSVIEDIPDHGFADCTKLSFISIKDSVTIGAYAFRNCIALKEIKTGLLNVDGIMDYAFAGCTALETVDLPKSVIYIGKRVFDGCTKLATVKIRYCNEDTGVADELLVIEEDAFPDIYKNITIYGYDGVVKDYALSSAHAFKKFVTLFEKFKISAAKGEKSFSTYMSLKTNQDEDKARPGTVVQITISPKDIEGEEPRRIQRNSLYDVNGGLDKSDIKFISGDANSQKFEFTMPDQAVVIDMDPGLAYFKDSNISNSEMTSYIAAYDDNGVKFTPEGDNNFSADRPGYKGRIQINATKNSITYNVGEWMFDYSSDNEKVVKVNSKGVITTVGPGYATITAKYKNKNKKVELKIYVGPAADITTLTILPDKMKFLADYTVERTYKNDYGEDIVYEEVPVVEITQNELNAAKQQIKLNLYATDAIGSDTYYINSNWHIGNQSLLELKTDKTDDNNNTVTVKKSVSGETYVWASYETGDKDEKGRKIIIYAYIIIKIVDITPRITAGEIRVDINKDVEATGGTPITITAYNGYDIDEAYGFTFWKGKKRLSYDGLRLLYDGENNYRLIANPNGADKGLDPGKSNIYTGDTALYIRGQYGSGEAFEIPMTMVIVENKKMELKTTLDGTINLFYNSTCYDPLNVPGHEEELARKNKNEKDEDYIKRYINATIGKVNVTNNISKKTAVVDHAQLWTKQRYQNWIASKKTNIYFDNDPDDPLSRNFTISVNAISPQNLVITRSDNSLATERKGEDKYVAITSGYLAVYFEGYSKPLVQQISIPNKVSAPSYKMSATSVTDNNRNTKGVFTFKILNSKNKPVITEESTSLVWLDTSCKSEFDESSVGVSGELFSVSSKVNDGKKSAILHVLRTNWDVNTGVKYKLTVSYTDKDPSAKFSTSSPKLNTAFSGTPAEFTLALNEVNCILTLSGDVKESGETFLYVGNSKYEDEASKLTIEDHEVDGEPNKRLITISFDDSDKPRPGKYKFAVVPMFNWGENAKQMDNPRALKQTTFTVNVVDSSPKLKLKGSTLTFNMLYPEKDVWESAASFSNLPSGLKLEDIDPIIETSGAEWVLAAKNPEKADKFGISDGVKDAIKIEHRYDEDAKKEYIVFTADESAFESYGKFSFTYYLNGITINDIPIKENSLKVTVKGSTKLASVTVSGKGPINTIDYTTNVKYKASFKNVKNPVISGVKVIDTYTGEESEEMYALPDEKERDVFHLYATHPDDVELANIKHPIKLYFDIMSDDSLDPMTKKLTITPVQVVPLLGANKSEVAFSAGVADDVRTAEVQLSKKSELKTHITNVKLSDKNLASVKDAFRIVGYIDEDDGDHIYENLPKDQKTLVAGTVVIQCIAPERVRTGKKYDLILEAEFDGQFCKRNKYGELVDKDGNIIDDYEDAVKIDGATITIPVVVNK